MSEIKNNGQANGLFHCRNLSYLNSRIENSIDRLEIKWDKFLLKNLKPEYLYNNLTFRNFINIFKSALNVKSC
jgi:hypothetical protein